MSIIANDYSLAWTLSDNTSGSSKMKRGEAGKPKVAPSSQDLLSISVKVPRWRMIGMQDS